MEIISIFYLVNWKLIPIFAKQFNNVAIFAISKLIINMEFTKEFKEKIKGHKKKYALSEQFGVSPSTLTRWLDLKNSKKLTPNENIEVLCEFTGLTQEQIFTKETI